jgi:hypothetical protein
MSWKTTPTFTWNETVWNPSMISTALWLDAADASTVTTVSGAVSQWNDKSGTGNHAVNATPASQPTYQATGFNGLPALSFDATDDFLGISSPVELASNADFFYAAVFQMRNSAGNWRMVMGGRGAFNLSSTGGGGMPLLQRMAGNSQIGIHNTDVASAAVKVDVANLFAPTIATVGRAGGTFGNGGTVTVTATGPSQASYLTTGTQSWASAANTVFQIGGRQQSVTAWFDGTISECVALNRNATTLERQKIEGYLAHKWGLTASLPSDHPYKVNGPVP